MLRERIVEHLFIGEALQWFWTEGVTDVEVLRSESDSFGYDLIMERGETVRHIQLKTTLAGGKNDEVKVGLNLAKKPSGCVIWIFLPDIGEKIAKHAKGNAEGTKAERVAHRVIHRNKFQRLESLEEVLVRLF
jgi:hypothetical protein